MTDFGRQKQSGGIAGKQKVGPDTVTCPCAHHLLTSVMDLHHAGHAQLTWTESSCSQIHVTIQPD